jgi:adenylyltransferase/sulfurtransferase
LGALAGVAGSLAALEVIRAIVGFGEGLVGKLLMIDARSMRFETLGYGWVDNNPLSGKQPTSNRHLEARARASSDGHQRVILRGSARSAPRTSG